ncbi:MAG: hypothetical protein NXI25_08300 [bacterium]|nr:hypothetical protein [bacterium]
MKYWLFGLLSLLLSGCQSATPTSEAEGGAYSPQRFFSAGSFWNQPIGENPKIAPQNEAWIQLLANDPSCENIGVNVKSYTIPIYSVDSTTPRKVIREHAELQMGHSNFAEDGGDSLYHQHPDFRGQPIPIPEHLSPSPGSDAHVAIVDYAAGKAWDMWYVFRDSSSGQWFSNTGMAYDLYGDGVFEAGSFGARPGESIHQYGPGRAAGVPVFAGTIMYHEVVAGKIEHKLAGALRYADYQNFVYPPATWTDGNYEGGIPEGSTIQLDPGLDLDQFDLTDGEKVVARAMQEYGIVIVDFAVGTTTYAEGLWYDESRSWGGILRGWEEPGGIKSIPVKHYRVLDPAGNLRSGGDQKKAFFQKFLAQERDCD